MRKTSRATTMAETDREGTVAAAGQRAPASRTGAVGSVPPEAGGRRLPRTVGWATAAWAAAVACGVTETAMAVGGMVASGGDVPWAGLALRLVVYASAALLVLRFACGGQWARIALAVALGFVGLGTLLVPVATAVPDGGAVLAAMGYEAHGPAYLVVRVTHIVSVLTAWVLSFTPAANRYFRRSRGPSGV
ncbi:hypothetical protein ACFWTE_16430 [Nocardiopsis sp. NPDC058631]|uniref:hypothetical protein n=1 Tax=Nocardiopsis sp. NPDC058631 TaxID=3346566 RepID=UPI00364F5E3D